MKLSDKDFKISIIIMSTDLKKNMNTMKRWMEDMEKNKLNFSSWNKNRVPSEMKYLTDDFNNRLDNSREPESLKT